MMRVELAHFDGFSHKSGNYVVVIGYSKEKKMEQKKKHEKSLFPQAGP